MIQACHSEYTFAYQLFISTHSLAMFGECSLKFSSLIVVRLIENTLKRILHNGRIFLGYRKVEKYFMH